MKKLLLVLLLAWGATVSAQQTGTVTLSWTNATQNEDTSLIAAIDHGALAYTKIQYSVCTGANNDQVDFATAKTHLVSAHRTTTTVSTEGPAGDYCFVGTHVNSFGTESQLSNITIKTTTVAGQPRTFTTPLAPAGLSVKGDPTVYTIVRQENRFIFLPVGTVPPNTACIAEQTINEYTAVPVDQVTWSGTVRPVIVVAVCS
jgi:hypothetical protein